MSSVLTFAGSGNFPQSNAGTALGFLTDLKAAIDANAANSDFFWEVVGSDLVGPQSYVLLGRKDASDGRIAILCYTSSPGNTQPVLYGGVPYANYISIGYLPNGNASTLSNLSSTSGTVCGNDTGACQVATSQQASTAYASGARIFYFDSQEAVYICIGDPAGTTVYMLTAGELVEDAAGTTYPSTGACASTLANFHTNTFGWHPISQDQFNGYPQNCFVVNGFTAYGANAQCMNPFQTIGSWAYTTDISTDSFMADFAANKVWFAPMSLMPNKPKGAGALLKVRQLGYGPGQNVADNFTYYLTGPVPSAFYLANYTGSIGGFPYLTNFKLT